MNGPLQTEFGLEKESSWCHLIHLHSPTVTNRSLWSFIVTISIIVDIVLLFLLILVFFLVNDHLILLLLFLLLIHNIINKTTIPFSNVILSLPQLRLFIIPV